MAELPPDAGVESDRGSVTGMPRWVKVSLISAAVLALLVVVVLLISRGNHGPSRHMQPGDSRDSSPAAIVVAARDSR